MPDAALSHPARMRTSSAPITGAFVAALLVAWAVLIGFLGAGGIFAGVRGAPPLALLVASVMPIALFLVAFRYWPAFRAFVLAADQRLMLGMQVWRVGGFAFLALQAYGILPGYFALPAGLGDMAIGLTAPWLIVALIKRPEFVFSRTFVVWNLLGILDLIVALALGAIGSFLVASGGDTINTGAMAQLPLVLIPAYFVPMFLILHLSALFQARRRSA